MVCTPPSLIFRSIGVKLLELVPGSVPAVVVERSDEFEKGESFGKELEEAGLLGPAAGE